MDKPQAVERSRPGNDLVAAVPKFCLTLEELRRTADGRVRTSQEFLAHFFWHDEKGSKDEIFRHLPKDVRGPILSGWGIRGLKAALRDDDAKVESVVFDALVAGDVDHAAFEGGLTSELTVRWVPLTSWWSFWRGGKLSKKAIGKALEAAYELGLFDARWFLDTVEGRGGQLKGTDVLSDGLTKADLTDWVKRIHQSGDGTPKGIVAALGWEKIVAQTANDTLIAVLDAFATKAGLVAHASSLSPSAKTVEAAPASSAAASTAQASTTPASSGPPIIASVSRDDKSVKPPPRDDQGDVKLGKKKDTKAVSGEHEVVDTHTTETDIASDDGAVIVTLDEDVPMPSLPPEQDDEDNEATAVFSISDELGGSPRKHIKK